MCNSTAHFLLDWKSMYNSIAHIWVLGASAKKNKEQVINIDYERIPIN